jgi:hypothetical protein
MAGSLEEFVRSAGERDCGKLKKVDGGAVAQLGARLDGIEEVVGSNPIGSTILRNQRTYRPKSPTVASFAFSSCIQA